MRYTNPRLLYLWARRDPLELINFGVYSDPRVDSGSLFNFCRAMLYIAHADCAVARCLSAVRPSHAGIMLKRLNVTSNFYTIG